LALELLKPIQPTPNLVTHIDDFSDLRKEMRQLQNENQRLHGELGEKERRIKELERHIKEKERRIKELERRIEELQKTQSQPEWATFEATAYVADCDGCSGITKTGYDVRNTVYTPEGLRVIAVDPAVIPLGTTVEIRLADGRTFKAKAIDVGGAINNYEIDILVDSYDKAIQFGRQDVDLRILKEARR
jgi:3D (Asp-Asp-Asp) domain-containing protein